MRIGLVSDTHDHIDHIQRAVDYLRNTGVDVVLHAGDVTSPHVLTCFEGLELWIAQGNMDRDPALSIKTATLFGADRFAPLHVLNFDGHRVALLHGHDKADLHELMYSEEYEYIIRGHTHAQSDRRIRGTRVLNPGAVGNTGWRRSTFAILNLATGEVEPVLI